MKDNQKVYIRGNIKRGMEVIKLLEDLGGSNTSSLHGTRDEAYYFIKPNGVIDNTSIIGGALRPFIKEFYKEVKLPRWKPKYKEHYYCINWEGAVVETTWYDTQDEEICYEFGNCFKTYEEAKEASRKIKEMLNK